MTTEHDGTAQQNQDPSTPHPEPPSEAMPQALSLGLFTAGWHETAPPCGPVAGVERCAWLSRSRNALLILTTDRYATVDVDLRGAAGKTASWLVPGWQACLPLWPGEAVVAAAKPAADPAPNGILPVALIEAGWLCRRLDDPTTGCPMWHWTGPRPGEHLRRGPDCPDARGGWQIARPGPDRRPAHGYATRNTPPAVIAALVLTEPAPTRLFPVSEVNEGGR